MTWSLLLVEDDFGLRTGLGATLRNAGYSLRAVASAEEAEHSVAEETPHVVLLDWGLPGAAGIELLKKWRGAGKTFPVIFLTARDETSDRVLGLNSGADDYLTKPFATEELLARINVQLRRQSNTLTEVVLSSAVVDLKQCVVTRGSKSETLTATETALITYFAAHPERVIERDELLREVWGYRSGVHSRAIDNTVARLRGKVEADPTRPHHILTVHGVGYRFVKTLTGAEPAFARFEGLWRFR